MTRPEVISTVRAMRGLVQAAQRAGRRVGVVPTMGALHDGHLSLVAASRAACDVTVATIFVNPTQFAPHEDFSRYPRTMDADLAKLAAAGVDYVFAPEVAEMYPIGAATMVEVGGVAQPLEGQFRPGHFRGVATIVLKLFQAVPADVAFFGQKDYQQSLVVRRMVADLLLPIDVVVCPIVRESDGLAMSSRNVYLSAEDRLKALSISRTIRLAETLVAGGERDAGVVAARMLEELRDGGIESIDYAAVADAETLAPIQRIEFRAVALIAARVGPTRLIDNAILDQPSN
ncbi:MAG: pantoate--beta-alanine ligase [Pirellulales bacterium]